METWIGISIGDVTGIGPEVTLKALAAEEAGVEEVRYLLIGDRLCLARLNDQLGSPLSLQPFTDYQAPGRFFVYDPRPEPLACDLAPGSPAAAIAAVEWLTEGANRCLRQELSALITAPVNKEAIIRSGCPFVGQTELVSELAGTSRSAMMLLGQDERGHWLRVALATAHLPLRLVADELTQDKIVMTIELAAQACSDLDLPRARVAVCGLNPHAGEGGEFGTEETTVIAPAVKAVQSRGLDVIGPLAADTVFYHALRGDYEVVVAMYHDQGLAPLKTLAFHTGVNWTLGLPFIRTSPDHGTAYDIAGKNLASPSSMSAALRLARQLLRRGMRVGKS
jgi:4-hydroxythreonine-4-phosphate dehydrogenase